MRSMEFDGKFTPEVRARLRAKRLELGASFQALGEHLGVHASTLRKWEMGGILDCHGRNLTRLRRYLRGEYDAAAAKASPARSAMASRGLAPELRLCISRMPELYGLCCRYPGLGERMVAAFSATYRQIVRELHRASAVQPEQ